jgi:hypothetical protein
MRIWSVHPKYLDAKGLVALWRETLLAKHVLEGKSKGYKNHPQLNRFKSCQRPVDAINSYLAIVHQEATCRRYNFDKQKVDWNFHPTSLPVTNAQLKNEVTHLLKKLKIRDVKKYRQLKNQLFVEQHPLFNLIDGPVEDWEIVTPGK